MKLVFKLFMPLVIILSLFLYCNRTVASEVKEPVNLVIVIDYSIANPALSQYYLEPAIKQGCLVMVTMATLYNALPSLFTSLTDSGYKIYYDVEKRKILPDEKKETFALLVPANEDRSLAQLGFDEKKWAQEKNLKDFFKRFQMRQGVKKAFRNYNNDPLDKPWFDHFKEQFKKTSNPLQIFIVGHGKSGNFVTEKDTNKEVLVEGQIVGMPINMYQEFLQFLSQDKNVRFLWISSCFSGGVNVAAYHEALNNSSGRPPFIIVNESVGDIRLMAGGDKDFVKLFKTVTAFFNQPNPPLYLAGYSNLGKKTAAKIKISDVVKSYFVTKPALENLPSVYLPGASFFRAVDVDNTLIITALFVKRLRIASGIKDIAARDKATKDTIKKIDDVLSELSQELEKIVKPYTVKGKVNLTKMDAKELERVQVLQKNIQKQEADLAKLLALKSKFIVSLTVPSELESIRVYPQDLQDIELTMVKKVPPVISMIPGKAHHIFGHINASENSLLQLLKGFRFATTLYMYDVPKGFFIEQLTAQNDGNSGFSGATPLQLSGIGILNGKFSVSAAIFAKFKDQFEDNIMSSGENKIMKENMALVVCSRHTTDTEYYMTVYNSLSAKKLVWKKISRTDYKELLNFIKSRTMPKAVLLKDATADMEDLETVNQAFEKFMNKN